MNGAMCRNIRVLHNFKPPTSKDEMAAAALQYVRKVSGLQKVPLADAEAFEEAVREVTASTQKLLKRLHKHGEPRTREGEKEKARLRWKRREEQLRSAMAVHFDGVKTNG